MFRLDGKNAVVTGAATGVGRGIAVSLAKQGANVAVTDMHGVSTESVIEEISSFGVRAFSVEMDVSDEKLVNTGMEQILSKFNAVDILCCNAGINTFEDLETITVENWDRHFDINVKGAILPIRPVIGGMKDNKFGRIIFTSSQVGLVGRPKVPAYCASKGALISLARSLALDYAEYGITVNCIAPTFVETDLIKKWMENPANREFAMSMIPRKRLATMEDVGSAVAFLASEEAHMTTGAVLTIDGGWTIH